MPELSTINAPAAFKSPRLRSLVDFIALIAVVLALGFAGHLAGLRPISGGGAHAVASQDVRR